MEFTFAESLDQVVGLLADDPHGTTVIAGGTAVVLMLKHRLIAPDRLVSIDRLDGLRGITVTDDVVSLGGTTRIADVARHPTLAADLPALTQAAGLVGNTRIRNAASIGGNVAEADYASDPPAVLVAADATARIIGPDGPRTAPVADVITGFYSTSLDPGEVITAIDVPRVPGRRSTYLKYRTRSSEDRPCAGVAATATLAEDGTIADLRVVVGAAGPRPQQLAEVTAAAVGQRLDPATIGEVAARYGTDLEMMEDHRGSAWYRSRLVAVLVRRALTALATPQEAAA